MYGYVYKTTNLINQKVYIGKHQSNSFDPTYLGSGKILKQAIRKNGKENFKVEILVKAESEEELNILEKKYISIYKQEYGQDCYNLAAGGEGGNVFEYSSDSEKEEFIAKMTVINRARCQSDDFREKCRVRFTNLYQDPAERQKQSDKIRKSWSNDELKAAQRERTRRHWELYGRDMSCLYKECIVIIKDDEYVFESTKAMYKFFKEKYDFVPGRDIVRKLISEGKDGPGYRPLFKNKFKDLIGMKIYRKECID